MNALSIRDAYTAGYEHGWSLASWNAHSVQFGMTLSRDLDWVGIGRIETVEDWLDAFDCIISAADESSRCYSPFEFTAHAINERDEAYGECSAQDGWDAFDRGMSNGANAYRRKYYPIRELKKDLREFLAESEDA